MMKLLFYKGMKGNLLDKLICIWTNGVYSHVEFVFNETKESWICFSSSPRENKVRFKEIKKDNEKWLEIDITKLKLNYDKMYEFAKSQEGKKYDYISIFFTFLLPLNLEAKNKWFCSEICSKLLLEGGCNFREPPHKIHPNKLYKLIIERLNLSHL